jgi:hypothetical protein
VDCHSCILIQNVVQTYDKVTCKTIPVIRNYDELFWFKSTCVISMSWNCPTTSLYRNIFS